jgi:hypothetical protein
MGCPSHTDGWTMPLRLAIALAAAALLAGCDSSQSPKKLSGKDVERLLEGKNGPNVVCTKGSDGWDYTCKTVRRKIGVDVHEDGSSELSNWTPVDEPLAVGPGGEGPAVHARFVDEANGVCEQSNSMIGRLTRPVSRLDAMARLDQVRDLRFIEVAQLDAIKPPVAFQADYTAMVAAVRGVGDAEMALRDAIVTRPVSARATARASALASRRRGAAQVRELALRLGLRACSDAAVPIPGIVR